MKKTITFSMTHPDLPAGPVHGFRFLWAWYVNGFRPEVHCQRCFKGKRVDEFCTGHAQSGRTYEFNAMDRFEYVYVCGVGSGLKSSLAVSSVTASTYNGYTVT